jgi:hypothetical protein
MPFPRQTKCSWIWKVDREIGFAVSWDFGFQAICLRAFLELKSREVISLKSRKLGIDEWRDPSEEGISFEDGEGIISISWSNEMGSSERCECSSETHDLFCL